MLKLTYKNLEFQTFPGEDPLTLHFPRGGKEGEIRGSDWGREQKREGMKGVRERKRKWRRTKRERNGRVGRDALPQTKIPLHH